MRRTSPPLTTFGSVAVTITSASEIGLRRTDASAGIRAAALHGVCRTTGSHPRDRLAGGPARAGQRRLLAALACLVGWTSGLAGQEPNRPRIDLVGPAISTLVAGLTAASPHLLHINEGPPPCAPCSPTNLPAFDRWAVRPPSSGWSRASDASLAALGLATLIDLSSGANGARRAATSAEAAAWALALTEFAKASFGRMRPVMYTGQADVAAESVGARRSFPSGHAAVAFAIATNYWLDGRGHRGPQHWLALGGATLVGVSRVVGAQHFPSDVVAGALLGTATAVLVHEIRF